VLDAVSRRESDRVPVDLGGSMVTSIHQKGHDNLKKYLGINLDRPTEIARGRSLVARVDHEVQDRLGVDVRMLTVNSPDGWEDEAGGERLTDAWGIVWARPEGFDNYEIVDSPLFGDITVNDVRNMAWPEAVPSGFTRGIREKALALRRKTDKAIIANLAMQIHTQSYFLRGFSQYLMDLIMNPALIEAIMDRVLDIFVERSRAIMAEIGDLVDIVYVADDLGAQKGPLFSPQIYRQLLKPRQKKLFEAIKQGSDVKIFYHTCGSVLEFIDDLAEVGSTFSIRFRFRPGEWIQKSLRNASATKSAFGEASTPKPFCLSKLLLRSRMRSKS
jgi:uroporphyrinogen decarboxylase